MMRMSCEKSAPDYRALFAVRDNHTLSVSSTRSASRDGSVFETLWLNERDAHKRLIARYRTWTNQSLSPPYRSQRGWERYSPTGDLLDREIRYTRRDTMEYVH